MSDNQWGPPGQYPQQPPPGGQGPYPPGQFPQGQFPRGQFPQGQVPPPGPFAPQPWQQSPQYGGMPPGPNQQLPHGLGWGAQPGGPRPPKKKGGRAKAVLLVLGLLVGAMVLLSVVSSVLKHNSSSSSPYYTPTNDPTYSPTHSSTDSDSPSMAPSLPTTKPTKAVTTKPTIVKPTAPRTGTTPPVKRGPTDYELVSRNRLYAAGTMGSVNCKESKARPSSTAGARANYVQLKACLARAWPALVNRAGASFRQPTVQMFNGSISTPCGTSSDTGPPFYCGSNETIYMNLSEDIGNYNRYPESYNKIWARMWMLHQFAHEYGHHIQNLTGILQANHAMRYDAPSRAAELEMTRRLELQASCFSDIFIGANKRSYPVTGQSLFQWKWLIVHTTDYANDHGDAVNHQYWATRGFTSRSPAACNTFTSTSARVR